MNILSRSIERERMFDEERERREAEVFFKQVTTVIGRQDLKISKDC